MRRLILAVILGAAAPTWAAAQSNEIDLDVIPVTATVTYAWQHAPGRYWGVFAGAGWDEFGYTLTPDKDSPTYHELEQILFVGALRRWRSAKWDVDVAVRAGLGDLRETGDLPSPFVALTGSALWGGRRFKIGPRLIVASVSDTGNSDVAVHLDVITGRIIFGW
jgi:hypothetical protein